MGKPEPDYSCYYCSYTGIPLFFFSASLSFFNHQLHPSLHHPAPALPKVEVRGAKGVTVDRTVELSAFVVYSLNHLCVLVIVIVSSRLISRADPMTNAATTIFPADTFQQLEFVCYQKTRSLNSLVSVDVLSVLIPNSRAPNKAVSDTQVTLQLREEQGLHGGTK